MAHRLRPPLDSVEIFHDGERIVAARGEPLAHALIGADRLLLARSPKLHRPRGPHCLRGACDGCLARVNGVPNVMTCLRPASGGERIETQNVLGSRGVDMLRAADFLFPRGIDHHRLFAGIRGLSPVVQKFARRVAGLGKLPSEAQPVTEARRLDCDVLIVGAGRAGLSVARELSGLSVVVVDDAVAPGGTLSLLDPPAAERAIADARRAGAQLLSRTTAVSLSREPTDGAALWSLAAGPDGALLVKARVVVVCSGVHDVTLAFEGNDLPGVMSARAALRLWRGGIAVGKRVAAVGSGPALGALAAGAKEDIAFVNVDPAHLERASGRSRVSSVLQSEAPRRVAVDAVVIDGPGAPAFELCVQAGAEVEFINAGYRPRASTDGRVAERVYCAGSVIGRDAADTARATAKAVRAVL